MAVKSTLEHQVTSVLRSIRQRSAKELALSPRSLAGLRRVTSTGHTPATRPSTAEAIVPAAAERTKAA